MISQEATSLVIDNNDNNNIILKYNVYNGQNTQNESLQINNYKLKNTYTYVNNNIDMLVILDNSYIKINSNIKVQGILTDSTSKLDIPYNKILVLPTIFSFSGLEINLYGAIIGAQTLILKGYAILNIYSNSAWMSSIEYDKYKTYLNNNELIRNNYDIHNYNYSFIFNHINISNIILEDFASIRIINYRKNNNANNSTILKISCSFLNISSQATVSSTGQGYQSVPIGRLCFL